VEKQGMRLRPFQRPNNIRSDHRLGGTKVADSAIAESRATGKGSLCFCCSLDTVIKDVFSKTDNDHRPPCCRKRLDCAPEHGVRRAWIASVI
jgi:hypothetical protein